MSKTVVTVLVCCLLVSALAWGQAKVIKLRNGETIIGEVVETKDGYQVTSRGMTIVLPKDQVASVENLTGPIPPKAEFEQRLAKVDPNNADQCCALGEWAFNKGLYADAQKTLLDALKANPAHTKSKLLLSQVEAKLKGVVETQPTRPVGTRPVGPTSAGAGDLIGDEDINRIRQVELRDKENVSVDLRNNVVKRFIDQNRGKGDFESSTFENDFLGSPPARQAYYMLRHTDRTSAMRDDIVIKSDPKSMLEFRNRIWPKVRQGCGQTQCHGGEKLVGGLKFLPGRTERADYTNFIIFVGFVMKDGARLIDRSTPEDSLYLNHALPPDLARVKHSKPVTALYLNRESPEFKQMLAWIGSLEGPPFPDYRLDYKAPMGMTIQTSANMDFLNVTPSTNPAPTTGPAEPPKPGG